MPKFGFHRFRPFQRWRRVGRLTDLVVALGLILALATIAAVFQIKNREIPEVTGFGVAIDGDSIRVNDDELRLEGIDAPEFSQMCGDSAGRSYACGRVARQALSRILAHGPIRCAISARDRYDRKLARCFLDGQDVNAQMVRGGNAVAFGQYETEEAQARSLRLGVWAGAFERPADFRRRHPRGDRR